MATRSHVRRPWTRRARWLAVPAIVVNAGPGHWRPRRRVRSSAALAALTAALSAVSPVAVMADHSSAATAPGSDSGWSSPKDVIPQPDLHAASTEHIDSRLLEFTFTTDNLPATSSVRVLLPAGYRQHPRRRYPVLYLLDGCCNDAPQARDWTTPSTKGKAEKITAGIPLITVMPDAGKAGFYTDWVLPGAQGQPRWESYVIGQLIPWVEARFRTRAFRQGRAIAGLSMGGFGAMSLAARHPDMFISASSFSGIVDSNVNPEFDETLFVMDGGSPDSVFGDRQAQQILWRAHNPADLARNLQGLSLSLYTGNGAGDGESRDAIEPTVEEQTLSLHSALARARIPHLLNDYGPGTHSWPYWNRDLRWVLPRVMRSFGGRSDPQSFTYTSAEPTFEDFGYVVRMKREVREFATLSKVTAAGFTLTGSGSGQVSTAPRYQPRQTYTVELVGRSGTATKRVTASRRGRLTFDVPLCASSTQDQYSPINTGDRRSCATRINISR